jgi:predicted transcriptional regulator
MQEALPFVDISTPIDTLSKMVSGDQEAVLVKDFKLDKNYIITRYDIANILSK